MNNIPENIIKAVADAAFSQSPTSPLSCAPGGAGWPHQSSDRRAVIQHALSNPALAPFLGGIGEYTDAELMRAWNHREYRGGKMSTTRNLRAFLAALPRRESPALAEAIARAEKAEKELSAQLGILRPIAEMPETVPEGCFMVSGWQASGKYWMMNGAKHRGDTHFAILRLPGAEATPPAECPISHTDKNKEFQDAAGYCMICGADWPEPAAHVPLGPEDCPPGTVFRCDNDHWFQALYASPLGVCINNLGLPIQHKWHELAERWQINTSLPDTGRWDKEAWRVCSKPAGKEVAK